MSGSTISGPAVALPEGSPQNGDPTVIQPAQSKPFGRAGRNLPAATAVGVLLAALVVASVSLYRPAFVAVVAVAAAVGTVELAGAMSREGRRLPAVPLAAGAILTLWAAYAKGAPALVLALVLAVIAVALWRLTDGPKGYLRDVAAGAFTLVYVPGLAGFSALILREPHGSLRVLAYIGAVACSDVGGYAAGVLAGRHPMAPRLSPKKSWEGLAGSVVASVGWGVVLVGVALGAALWQGALFGVAAALSATLGDLGESMIKRDLGIKDMASTLPGHGGLMDRLDSQLPTAPLAWLLFAAFLG